MRRSRNWIPALGLCASLTLAAGACGSSADPAPIAPGASDAAGPSTSNPGDHDGGVASADGAATGGCGGSLLANPDDLSLEGPWAVGAKHVTVGALSVEVWYPAAAAAAAGQSVVQYDIRQDLPADQAAKISDSDNPYQPCNDCFRDLPIDGAHGPYPLVVFVHGTAGFKTQNLDNMIHWASRGFVVMAANHPGLSIGSFVGGAGGAQNLSGDVQAEITAMTNAVGDLSMFAGRVDVTRIGLAGHSAGGNGVAQMGGLAGVQVIIELSSNNAPVGANVRSTLFVSGRADGVVSFDSVQSAYDSTTGTKRLVGIDGVAHTGVTSLCGIQNAKGESIVTVAKNSGVLSGLLGVLADGLFDCDKNTTSQAEAVPIVSFATSGALEETLQCRPSAAGQLAAIQSKFPEVSIYAAKP